MKSIYTLSLLILVSTPGWAAAPTNSALQFPSQKLLAIPASIKGATGRNNQSLTIVFAANGGEQLTCNYSPDKNSGNYIFANCGGQRPFCQWNREYGDAREFTAGEFVNADSLRLTAPACTASGCAAVEAAALFPAPVDACGATATAGVHLLGDLSCPSAGVGLRMIAKNSGVDGRGHSIVAPAASIGLYVEGNNDAVVNVQANNASNGTGLMAYNTEGLVVANSVFKGNQTGVNVYVDAISPNLVTINGNDLSNNSSIGLRFTGDNGKRVNYPMILRNDLSHSGYYALWLDVANAYLDGSFGNKFHDSQSGIWFTGSVFYAWNLDLAKSDIPQTQVFVSTAEAAYVSHCNLTYRAPALSTQERVAISFYEVKQIWVDGLTVKDSDVGLKVASDNNISSNLSLMNSTLEHSMVAGVMLQSYDNTALGNMQITGNELRFNPANMAIWTVGSTQVGAGSQIKGNTE